ncbi:hypothetical protein F5887DRAFT_916124 [Amanita rubescens]|nr:hypothetical protein F5887DRAFT_916124 [Amanita rubescens]
MTFYNPFTSIWDLMAQQEALSSRPLCMRRDGSQGSISILINQLVLISMFACRLIERVSNDNTQSNVVNVEANAGEKRGFKPKKIDVPHAAKSAEDEGEADGMDSAGSNGDDDMIVDGPPPGNTNGNDMDGTESVVKEGTKAKGKKKAAKKVAKKAGKKAVKKVASEHETTDDEYQDVAEEDDGMDEERPPTKASKGKKAGTTAKETAKQSMNEMKVVDAQFSINIINYTPFYNTSTINIS